MLENLSSLPALPTLPRLPVWWPLPLGFLATASLWGAWRLARHRRRAARDLADGSWAEDFITAIAEEPEAPKPEPAPIPQPAPGAAPQRPRAKASSSSLASLVPLPDSIPAPANRSAAPRTAGAGLTLCFEPTRMAATLLNATLSYRLTLSNHGHRSLAHVVVSGNMIAAHAALPAAQQLATDDQVLDRLGEIAHLPPGESITIEGELRLPLSGITPIHNGAALLFVPLARFRAHGQDADVRAAFVVGKSPPDPKAALLPFRFDLGPRIWPRLGARQISLPQDQDALTA